MIVSDNANLYGTLFEKANSALGFVTKEDKITNIDEYFTCIKRLAQYEQDNKTDPIFTILPINEDTFDIDANTRKIDIPSSFMTSGIGVKGDEVAEILYFTIDRYFDITDLYYKEIFIQWKNAAGDEGLSLTINKSLSYKPGKVTFGWPISSEITSAVGNVQFAVRFYDRFEDDTESYLTYSFSTLTATVKVNPSLDFTISDKDAITSIVVNRTQRIFDNLKDSATTGVINPAAIPQFEAEFELSDSMNLKDLTTSITINGEEKKVFMVKAYIPEGAFGAVGNIKYAWEHRDNNGILLQTPTFGDHYEFTNDSIRKDNETYYELKDGVYSVYIGEKGESFPLNTYYEKYSYCVPTTAGVYKVTATNVAGRTSIAEITDSCLVPYAKEVLYSANDNSIILEKEVVNGVIQNTFVAQELKYDITQQDAGTLSYQWKYNSNPAINGKDEEAIAIEGATQKIYKAKDLGHYWLEVTNTYNNNTVTCMPSKPFRVTEAASEPTIIQFKVGNEPPIELSGFKTVNKNTEISYVLGFTENTDNIYEYQWMKADGDDNFTITVEGATSAIFKPTEAGTYACKITNVYNEDRKSMLTENNVFMVNG